MSFVTVTSGRGKAFVQAVLAQDAATIAAQEAEIARRTKLEIARLRDKAEAEGRAQGEDEAEAALVQQRAELSTAAAALGEAWNQIATPLANKEQELAALVTELSFLLARHIIGAEAASNPASLQSLVSRLLAEAANERRPRQSLVLRVNPADHAHLAAFVAPEETSLLPDGKISPGGALLEIITPEGDPLDKIEWDATVEGRLEAMRQALGKTP